MGFCCPLDVSQKSPRSRHAVRRESACSRSTSEIRLERFACRILCASKGWPANGKRFLPGTRSEPQRAGMMAMTEEGLGMWLESTHLPLPVIMKPAFFCHKLIERALFNDPAGFQHDDRIGVTD